MKNGLFKKANGALLPADQDTVDSLNKMPMGEDVLVTYKKGRSVQNHKRFFTFVKSTFDWQDTYENDEVWLHVLKVLAGHYELVVGKNGSTQYVSKSINFGAMDETEFCAFFNRVIDGYLKSDYAKGLSNQQLSMVAMY